MSTLLEASEIQSKGLVPFFEYNYLLEKIVGLVESAGYEVRAYRSETSEPEFLKLSSRAQAEVLEGLKNFYDVHAEAAASGASLRGDGQAAAWWTIRNLTWRPLSDVFSFVKPGDTLEIYDRHHKQIFRSFNMFRCLSYSLDELVTHQWSELYERPEGVAKAVMFDISRAMTEVCTIAGDAITSPDHVVEERFSLRKRRALYQTRAVSPLMSASGQVAGFLNVISATPLKLREIPTEFSL